MKKPYARGLYMAIPVLLAVVMALAASCSPAADPPEENVSGADGAEAETKTEDTDPAPIDYEQYIGKAYKVDIAPYLDYIAPADPAPYLVLVNKTHLIDRDFVPGDLIDVRSTRQDGRATQRMTEAAAKALEAFMAEAAAEGITDVTVTSAYRSYDEQNSIFNMNVDNQQSKFASRAEAEDYVATFSARPGTSEHQTGLVADMHNLPSAEQSFGDTPEAAWLRENACRFGFILRYVAEKQPITGVSYEPWHFRFVGREAATEMFRSGQCLEEYLGEIA
ncbi:MAG: M15 family metallopeptidase [Clostridiales Family XIII bacterium]|nr:M15 family metallopeptidase [Clostridiales Family XIII bacterium]